MSVIAVLGGTFDPPHNGHISAVISAKNEIPFEKALFIPASLPPHKQLSVNASTKDQRLEMLALAVKDIPFAKVCDIEIKRGGKSYTYKTVEELKKSYDEIWLIVGTDMFLTIQSWKNAKDFLEKCNIAVSSRNNNDRQNELLNHAHYLESNFKTKVIVLKNKVLEVSSSKIRKELAEFGTSSYIDPSVLAYIKKNKLFGVISEGI